MNRCVECLEPVLEQEGWPHWWHIPSHKTTRDGGGPNPYYMYTVSAQRATLERFGEFCSQYRTAYTTEDL
jgi:hypothetical protein